MPTPSDAPVKGRRPYIGFDREEAAYAKRKAELLRSAEGQYVVLVGEDLEGPVVTFSEALRAGYQRFGPGPLYIKRVVAVEPVETVTRDVLPCRP